MYLNLLPLGLLALLLAAPAAVAQSPCGERVTVASGDTLSRIAARCDVTLDALLAANPRIQNPDLIRVGLELSVPAADRAARSKPRGPTVGQLMNVREVRGTLTDEGVECQALRGEDGRLYTLTGDLEGFTAGDRVRVTGQVAETSFCMQGTTLGVRSIAGLD